MNDLFIKMWTGDATMFSSIKEQYEKMLSSTPDAKAHAWREKMGITGNDNV